MVYLSSVLWQYLLHLTVNCICWCCVYYRHIEWDDDDHSFVIKSTHFKPPLIEGRDGSRNPLALAVLTLWPIAVTGLIIINQKVTAWSLLCN